MLEQLDETIFIQRSGEAPDVLLTATSAGEHGIGVARFRFADGAVARGHASHHLLMFSLAEPARIACRVNSMRLDHLAPTGNVTLCPAGSDFGGESASSLNILLLAIPKEPIACLSAERARPQTKLAPRLSGCDDHLLGIAGDLFDEAASAFLGGPRCWAELTDALISHLLDAYLLAEPVAPRGVLTREALARINAYVLEHLEEPIDVDTIADLALKGRSQFPRIFRRSVGMSPYQYVIRLRLRQALRLMKRAEIPLAEVAAATGFVDQSHLCRWIKRIYGTSPAQLLGSARRSPAFAKRANLQAPMISRL
jgi:AraC family transcriptional regulator